MAVTQISDGNKKQTVAQRAKLSRREVAVSDAYVPIQLRKSHGTSSGHREINEDSSEIVRSYKLRKKQENINKSDSLSDVDDAEVSGYLNTKEEILYKTILWEAINRNYKNAKKRKRATETKKAVSAERAAELSEKVDLQKRSTRINYDALKHLNCELTEDSETVHTFTGDSYRSEDSQQGNVGHGMQGSKLSSTVRKNTHGISSFSDNDDFGYHDSEIGNEYEHIDEYADEHIDDSYFDF